MLRVEQKLLLSLVRFGEFGWSWPSLSEWLYFRFTPISLLLAAVMKLPANDNTQNGIHSDRLMIVGLWFGWLGRWEVKFKHAVISLHDPVIFTFSKKLQSSTYIRRNPWTWRQAFLPTCLKRSHDASCFCHHLWSSLCWGKSTISHSVDAMVDLIILNLCYSLL